MKEIYLNGKMSIGLQRGKNIRLEAGRSCFMISTGSNTRPIFPDIQTMERLARRFLGGEYREDVFSRGYNQEHFLYFTIPTGTNPEDRAAFLAAVDYNTKYKVPN